MMMQGLANLKF